MRSLFVGYVLMQIPSNMLITRIRPGIYMSAWMLVWALVSGCTALVQNFGGLVACRFFLGITEAPVSTYQSMFTVTQILTMRSSILVLHICFPCSILVEVSHSIPCRVIECTVLAYILTEVAARIALLYCAQILATGFSGLIAAGIFAGLDDVRGIQGWRW